MKVARTKGWSRGGGANAKFLTKGDVIRYTDLGSAFQDNTEITHFSEFRFFTNVTGVTTQGSFKNAKNLEEVVLPPACRRITFFTFDGCSKLKYFNPVLPNNVTRADGANQAFARTSSMRRWNSEYDLCIEDKNIGIWTDILTTSTPITTAFFNWQGRPTMNKEIYRGLDAIKRIIINIDPFPQITANLLFNVVVNNANTTVYYLRGANISTFQSKMNRCTYVPCDRDKFGNLVLPFRLKKWWEPDVT